MKQEGHRELGQWTETLGTETIPVLLVAFWAKGLNLEPRPDCQLKSQWTHTHIHTKQVDGHEHEDRPEGTDRHTDSWREPLTDPLRHTHFRTEANTGRPT